MTQSTPSALGAHADLAVTPEEEQAFEALARALTTPSAPTADSVQTMNFAEHQLNVARIQGRGSKLISSFKPS